MKPRTQITARLEARLPSDVMARLKRAAEFQGRTVTDFVVAPADEAARQAIEQSEIIRLSVEDHRQIAETILNPPKPAPALRRAAKRYRSFAYVALPWMGGFQGRGLGAAMLMNAVHRTLQDAAAAYTLLVDAKNDRTQKALLNEAKQAEASRSGHDNFQI